MLEVGGHANGDASRDFPLPEFERDIGGDTGTAVHGAIAEPIVNCQQFILSQSLS